MTPWRRHLIALAAVIAALITLFARDAGAMAGQWWDSSTYQHCLFIVPIVGWLIWQRRREVAPILPASWLPGLVLVALGSLLWLVGEAAGVALIRHVALLLMIQASVPAILGPAVTRAILFPLFYLIFLVPFGDMFVPQLQTITAAMCMALLHLVGIPAHIDGVFITIPNGWFEVAEACSGVKFLVAMVAYGALAAHVCFRSWARRAAFMALCVAAPILANGVRAFSTIYAAHLTSVEAATGFDHIVYGWFFFAIVMILVMLISWRFFDRGVSDPWLRAWRPSDHRVRPLIPMMLAVAGTALLTVGANGALLAAGQVALPNAVTLPQVRGWTLSAPPETPWVARFDGADHRLYGHYRNARGGTVDLAVALYGFQDEGRKIVAFGQGAADPDSAWNWTADTVAPPGAHGERLLGTAKLAREAWTFYILPSGTTGAAMTVKLHTLLARLTGGDLRAAVVIMAAEDRAGQDAHAVLTQFHRDFGAPSARTARLFSMAQAR
jgi:exosortase A